MQELVSLWHEMMKYHKGMHPDFRISENADVAVTANPGRDAINGRKRLQPAVDVGSTDNKLGRRNSRPKSIQEGG